MSTTLYERLGGVEGITRLVDDVLHAHLNNPVVKSRLEKTSDIEHTRQRSIQFFCAGSGGPQTFSGSLLSGKNLDFTDREFIAAVDDIVWAMNKHTLDEDVQKDVLSVLYALKEEFALI